MLPKEFSNDRNKSHLVRSNLIEQGQDYTENASTHPSKTPLNFCCVAIDECGLVEHHAIPIHQLRPVFLNSFF